MSSVSKQQEYCISPLCVDKDGTIYYKNDSCYLMALETNGAYLDSVTAMPDTGSVNWDKRFQASETEYTLRVAENAHPDVVMLSIATRPDCLPPDVLHLLAECNRIKPVIVELGLQTSNETTAQFIRRGYPLSVYEDAVTKLKGLGIEVVTHVIAGLPGETKQDFYNTLSHVAACHSDGIKIQLLHILKGTDLAALYESGQCTVLTQEEYIDLVLQSIALLPPEMTIHRLTGDGPKELLLAPLWSSRKREVLNEIHKQLKQQNIWQGKEYKNHE